MKTLLVILLIYLIYRFIRNIAVITMRSRQPHKETFEEQAPAPKPTKIIEKDEGEYVDYEEVKE